MATEPPGDRRTVDDDLSLVDFYDYAPCGYASTDGDGTLIRVNQTLAGWVGRPAAELVGETLLTDLLSIGGRLYFETHLFPALLAGQPITEAAVDLRTPCASIPVLLGARVHRTDDAGRPRIVRYTLVDISLRRQYEQSLVEQREAALSVRDRADALARIGARIAALSTDEQIIAAVRGELIGAGAVRAASLEPAREELGTVPLFVPEASGDLVTGLLPLVGTAGRTFGTVRVTVGDVPDDEETQFFTEVALVTSRAIERTHRRPATADVTWPVGDLRNGIEWREIVKSALTSAAPGGAGTALVLLHLELDRCAAEHGAARCDDALLTSIDRWRESGHDSVFCIDGHERYGLVLKDTSEQTARVVAERLRLQAAPPLHLATAVTTSIGGETAETVIARAAQILASAQTSER